MTHRAAHPAQRRSTVREGADRVVKSNTTALAVTIGTSVTAVMGTQYHASLVYVSALLFSGYLGIWGVSLARDLGRLKKGPSRQRLPMIYSEVEHEWRVSAEGDFYGQYSFTVLNNSESPITLLPQDDAMWFGPPDDLSVTFRVDEGERRRITEYRHNLYSMLLSKLSGMQTKLITWAQVVDPPLPPGETFQYTMVLSTARSETAAFTPEGTYAGIPTTIPTGTAKLHFLAPPGYRITLLDPVVVVDAEGTRFPELERAATPPRVAASGSVLTWELLNPATARRYWFRYRFDRVP
jgi:hypothetical protein